MEEKEGVWWWLFGDEIGSDDDAHSVHDDLMRRESGNIAYSYYYDYMDELFGEGEGEGEEEEKKMDNNGEQGMDCF